MPTAGEKKDLSILKEYVFHCLLKNSFRGKPKYGSYIQVDFIIKMVFFHKKMIFFFYFVKKTLIFLILPWHNDYGERERGTSQYQMKGLMK